MFARRTGILTISLALTILGVGVTLTARPTELSYQRDPSAVALFVCTQRPNEGLDSMTVYGNSRVELRSIRDGKLEQYEIVLHDSEFSALLNLVTEYGLADYDSDHVRERLLRKMSPFPVSKNNITTVLISLFRSKALGISPIQRIIRLDILKAEEYLPDFDEFQGVAKLNQSMISLIDRARISGRSASSVPDFSSARFSFSRERSRLVLSVSSISSMTRRATSLKIYGDGVAELLVSRGSADERYMLMYSEREIESLLRSVISRGLMEYDVTSVRARQLIKNRGKPWSGPTDQSKFFLKISLESYSRAGYDWRPHERVFKIGNPAIVASAFPEITEFRALADLREHMFTKLNHEEGGD